MQKSILVAYTKQLSRHDWRALKKFVRSPYFNQRGDVIRLFDYLEKVVSALNINTLDRQVVFRQVYPQQAFDEKQLRHTASFLLKVIKKYFLQTELEQDQIQAQHYLCSALRKRRMDVFFEKELSNAYIQLEKSKFQDSNFHFKQYQIGMEEAIFTTPKRRSGVMNFPTIADQLTIAYISRVLRLSCNIQSHHTRADEVYTLKLLPKVLEILDQGTYLDIPAIAVHYYCYGAFEQLKKGNTDRSESNFYQLRTLIDQHWRIFPASEIRDIYLFAINYCIKRLNAGERSFIRAAFELFRSGLKNETLLEGGFLSSFSYKNITRLGMALQENDWVDNFLATYKKYLYPRERENTWRYNLAFFYFQQQRYMEAMPLLTQVEFKDVLNNLDARRMLLKSYFELGEYNALDSLLDSFSRYIQRQKEMGYHKDNYLNLIRIVKKLIQYPTRDKSALLALQKEIESTSQLAERAWLLEKLK